MCERRLLLSGPDLAVDGRAVALGPLVDGDLHQSSRDPASESGTAANGLTRSPRDNGRTYENHMKGTGRPVAAVPWGRLSSERADGGYRFEVGAGDASSRSELYLLGSRPLVREATAGDGEFQVSAAPRVPFGQERFTALSFRLPSDFAVTETDRIPEQESDLRNYIIAQWWQTTARNPAGITAADYDAGFGVASDDYDGPIAVGADVGHSGRPPLQLSIEATGGQLMLTMKANSNDPGSDHPLRRFWVRHEIAAVAIDPARWYDVVVRWRGSSVDAAAAPGGRLREDGVAELFIRADGERDYRLVGGMSGFRFGTEGTNAGGRLIGSLRQGEPSFGIKRKIGLYAPLGTSVDRRVWIDEVREGSRWADVDLDLTGRLDHHLAFDTRGDLARDGADPLGPHATRTVESVRRPLLHDVSVLELRESPVAIGSAAVRDAFAKKSVGFWFRPDETASETQLLYDEGGRSNGLAIRIRSGRLEAAVVTSRSGMRQRAVAGVAFASRGWTHIAATYDGDRLSLALDGRTVAQVAAPLGPVGRHTDPSALGGGRGGDAFGGPASAPAAGLFADLRISRDAWTTHQLGHLAAASPDGTERQPARVLSPITQLSLGDADRSAADLGLLAAVPRRYGRVPGARLVEFDLVLDTPRPRRTRLFLSGDALAGAVHAELVGVDFQSVGPLDGWSPPVLSELLPPGRVTLRLWIDAGATIDEIFLGFGSRVPAGA